MIPDELKQLHDLMHHQQEMLESWRLFFIYDINIGAEFEVAVQWLLEVWSLAESGRRLESVEKLRTLRDEYGDLSEVALEANRRKYGE